MKYEKIGQVFFDEEKKIIGRKPTKSNLIESSGSDNDIYLCNISQLDIVKKIENIMCIQNAVDFNKKIITMDFYGTDINIIFNINPQGRISFRITGKNRLYGMIKYIKEIYNIDFDVDNIAIIFDFEKYVIYFEKYSNICTIY